MINLISKIIYDRYKSARSIDLEECGLEIFLTWVREDTTRYEAKELSKKAFDLAEEWIKVRNERVKPL